MKKNSGSSGLGIVAAIVGGLAAGVAGAFFFND